MPLCLVNQGERLLLKALIDKLITVKLFTNDPAPVNDALTEADFVEATFPGYVDIDLVPANFVYAEGSPTKAEYNAEAVFTQDANAAVENVRGYYYVHTGPTDAGKLISYEKFDVVAPMRVIGDEIAFVPALRMKDDQD